MDEAIERIKNPDTIKIIIQLKQVGNAPILKQSLFKISRTHKFQAVIQFLRRELKYQGSDPLFLYINGAFAPSPDEPLDNLYKCFSIDGKLIVNYCTTAAWG
ncbi:autophagy protein 12, partial [Backusella circina FSU 941]